jgi:hypothetical protein
VGLTIGYATLVLAWSRRLWTSRAYWLAIAIAATSSVAIIVPFFLPFLDVQAETGFARSLDDARYWSAFVRSYLASGARAHTWMLPLIRDWNSAVLFPGFLSIALGTMGAFVAFRQRAPTGSVAPQRHDRETAILYGSIAVLTFWASLGPRAGLYTVFYVTIPVFSFLRAPERMGIVVILCLAVFAAYGVRALRERFPRYRAAIGAIACGAALIELNSVPFDWRLDRPIPSSYRALAAMPRGPLVEFPFYDRRSDFHIHTRSMLNSTAHWQPLVNGYSDHIPSDFRETATILATFPSVESFGVMRRFRVRYLTINRSQYGRSGTSKVEKRLQPYLEHLRLVADDGEVVIYEVVSWPR